MGGKKEITRFDFIKPSDSTVYERWEHDRGKCVFYADHRRIVDDKDKVIASKGKEVEALAKAIGDAAMKAGITSEDTGASLTGPQLILLCQNMGDFIKMLRDDAVVRKAHVEHLEAKIRSLTQPPPA